MAEDQFSEPFVFGHQNPVLITRQSKYINVRQTPMAIGYVDHIVASVPQRRKQRAGDVFVGKKLHYCRTKS